MHCTLTEQLIGTGGWAYFKVPNKTSLKAYSELFNFVEVNYTFYEYPDVKIVERWRRTVPKDFTFAIRCHQDLTHNIGLKPVDEAYAVLGRMMTYCGILDAPFLVFETPQTYTFDTKAIKDARDFLSSVNLKEVRLIWEARANIVPELANLMQDFHVVQGVDLSKTVPSFVSDVVYSRLFGNGKQNIYQFTDEELVKIEDRALQSKPRIVAFAYHGLRMNADAARFLSYTKTGAFPMATSSTGAGSARAVLSEDAVFPASKEELIDDQGWKVIDLTTEKRIHLSDLLAKIPENTYASVDEVVQAIGAIL